MLKCTLEAGLPEMISNNPGTQKKL